MLGEEATAGGTARYVDSSVERIQVSVRGIDPARHLVTCQGVPVPLTPSTARGAPGEYYAGVRYRAWQPWSALHPSIEVHAPLRFEVVDADAEASLGGATYHVVHPGGRSYEHPPVNANEAEARRASRFEPFGHTPGKLDVAAMREAGRRAASEDYPRTLDLRRASVGDGPPGLRRPPCPSRRCRAGRSDAARYDEVVGPDGALRPAWKGLAELRGRASRRPTCAGPTATSPRSSPTTASPTPGPGEGPGPWQLDPVPLIIDAASWARLEVGLAQRAELLNAVLADLYGDAAAAQRRHPPAGRGARPLGLHAGRRAASSRDPRPLVFSATDLGRDAEGQWRVLGDRAQAPSGIGYAMENRRVVSRVIPELYREAGLHRMEPYFWALRSALLQSAQGDRADPRVVVLSPGHPLGDGVRPGVRRLRARLPARPGQRPRGARRLGLDEVAGGRASSAST